MVRTAVVACGLFLTFVGFGQSAASNPTYTDIAGQVGLAKVTPSEGDMPVFPYRGSLAIVPSRHGDTWPGMVLNGTGSGASFRRGCQNPSMGLTTMKMQAAVSRAKI